MPVPLVVGLSWTFFPREDQVGRDAQGSPLVAFGNEGEEHLGLLGPLVEAAQVVQEQPADGMDNDLYDDDNPEEEAAIESEVTV